MEYGGKAAQQTTDNPVEEKDEPRAGSMVGTVIDSMTLVNRSYIYEFASEAYCRAHGRSREDIVGKSVTSVWGEANFNRFIKKHLDQCFAGNVVRYENWLELPGREHKYYRVSYSPYFDHNGEVTHAVVASTDVTDLKKEEEVLEKSEARFRTILKSMHYGVFTFDTEGRFTFVNDAVIERSGYPREWYMGKSLFDVVRSQERETVKRHFEATVRGEQVPPYEFAYRRATDDLAWVQISTTAVREGSKTAGVIGLLLDVTKRKLSEQALKESEEKYRTLFEDSRDAIFITDKGGKHTDVNRAYLDLFGYSREEAKRLSAVETYLNREDCRTYVKAIEERGFVQDFETKLKKKDGTVMDCLLTGTIQRTHDGAILGYRGIIRDQTEKKRVEAALRDSEQKLVSLLYGSPIPQFVIDREHRVTHWNRALEALTGIKAEEIVGTNKHWKAFYSTERPCIADLMLEEAESAMSDWYGGKLGKSTIVDGAYKATAFFQPSGGEGRWLCFTAAVIRDSQNNIVGALETLEDVTSGRPFSKEKEKETGPGE